MDNQILDQSEDLELPKSVYSSTGIFWVSFLFSPLFLAFMLYQNLSRVGKKQEAINAVILSLGLLGVMVLIGIMPIPSQVGFFVSTFGTQQIISSLWHEHLAFEIIRPKRSVLMPVLLGIFISIIIISSLIFKI
jgi:hypothetical protein